MWQRLNRIETAASADFTKVTLHSTAKTLQAVGMLVISKDGNYGTLVVENLPPLDPHGFDLYTPIFIINSS